MSDSPQITPSPYLDPQNVALLERVGALLGGKPFTDFTVDQLRELIDQIQSPVPEHPGIDISTFEVSTSKGKVRTYLYKPATAKCDLPFVYHIHGGGWALGDAKAYSAFVFDLVKRTGLAVVFPEYTLAPEQQYPIQQEQCLEVLQYVLQCGKSKGLKTDKVVISGDSAGGQLACAVSILSHQRSLNLPIVHQVLLHPVVDLSSLESTFSSWTFQNGPFLTTGTLKLFYDLYIPKVSGRTDILVSPGLMTAKQAKEFLPASTIIASQNDWLRDQDENFAKLLQSAGVPCGVIELVASIHDVEVFGQVRDSPTSKLSMSAIAETMKEALVGN